MARDRAAFFLVAPDLKTIDPVEIDGALGDAALQISDTVWGTRADLAVVLLAAHALALTHPGLVQSGDGSGAIVQSESIGPISVTYNRPSRASSSSSGGGSYSETAYGSRYLDLKRTLIMTPFAI